MSEHSLRAHELMLEKRGLRGAIRDAHAADRLSERAHMIVDRMERLHRTMSEAEQHRFRSAREQLNDAREALGNAVHQLERLAGATAAGPGLRKASARDRARREARARKTRRDQAKPRFRKGQKVASRSNPRDRGPILAIHDEGSFGYRYTIGIPNPFSPRRAPIRRIYPEYDLVETAPERRRR